MAETRSKRAERAGDIASRRNAQAYWAKKETAAEALRNPKVHTFSISFTIANPNFTEEEFEAAYDNTLAADVEAISPSLPPEVLAVLGEEYISPKVHKGHFFINEENVFIGGYLVPFTGSENERLKRTIPATVESIQETIANSTIENHGFVKLFLYTLKDESPTHLFVMYEHSNKFELIMAE